MVQLRALHSVFSFSLISFSLSHTHTHTHKHTSFSLSLTHTQTRTLQADVFATKVRCCKYFRIQFLPITYNTKQFSKQYFTIFLPVNMEKMLFYQFQQCSGVIIAIPANQPLVRFAILSLEVFARWYFLIAFTHCLQYKELTKEIFTTYTSQIMFQHVLRW